MLLKSEETLIMKDKKIKIVYAEPANYIPEYIRRELKLGEFAEPKQEEAKPASDEKDS